MAHDKARIIAFALVAPSILLLVGGCAVPSGPEAEARDTTSKPSPNVRGLRERWHRNSDMLGRGKHDHQVQQWHVSRETAPLELLAPLPHGRDMPPACAQGYPRIECGKQTTAFQFRLDG